MTAQREQNGRKRKRRVAVAGLAALLWSAALVQASPQETKTKVKEKQVLTKQNKFYCNIKAVNPAERESHKQLTDKLISARKEIVETEKGYEFQYSPSNVLIAQLADWVMAKGKCCPFFDFHIGLEREGKLLCLRLTGEEGSNRSSGQSFRYCRNNCATHESLQSTNGQLGFEASAERPANNLARKDIENDR
jgi:hypothetical protein